MTRSTFRITRFAGRLVRSLRSRSEAAQVTFWVGLILAIILIPILVIEFRAEVAFALKAALLTAIALGLAYLGWRFVRHFQTSSARTDAHGLSSKHQASAKPQSGTTRYNVESPLITRIACANPWYALPQSPPFVLPEDAVQIHSRNSKTKKSPFKLHLDLYPEPYVGDRSAPVVLLSLNPGYDATDPETHQRSDFAKLARANLLHQNTRYPFFFLDPSLQCAGSQYWRRALKPIIGEVGLDRVARGVLCVEYFAYHSERFNRPRRRIPSQEYSFFLVREAIKRGALIFLHRSLESWLVAVPELEHYGHRYQITNPQAPPRLSLERCPEGFSEAVRRLKRL